MDRRSNRNLPRTFPCQHGAIEGCGGQREFLAPVFARVPQQLGLRQPWVERRERMGLRLGVSFRFEQESTRDPTAPISEVVCPLTLPMSWQF